jgi:hypothetical protein
MSFEFRHNSEKKFLHVIVRRGIDIPFARDLAIASMKEAKKHDIKNYLYDMTGTPNIASTTENYHYAYEEMSEIGLDRNSRTAILVREGDNSHDFFETVARNAGFNVKIFTDTAEAEAWLVE